MKKFIICVLIMVSMVVCAIKTQAMTSYKDAMAQNKRIAILIYADWADDAQQALQNFKALESKYSSLYNFVALNIADPDTKEFNRVYHIYPRLPYMLLFKDQGKISRYMQKDCVLDTSCVTNKMDVFSN